MAEGRLSLFQIFNQHQRVQTRCMEPWIVAATFATFLLAGFVKGVVGLGLPTVAVGLLSLVMPPAQAAAFMVVPSFVTNVWQLANGPSLWQLLRRLRPMLAGICLGTWAGGALLHGRDTTAYATAALGVTLLLYAIAGLCRIAFYVPPEKEPWLSPIVGGATGVVTAATGVFVVPAVPYLQSLGLEKDELVQALGVAFTVSTLALAPVLMREGALQGRVAFISMLTLLPALAGMGLGQYVRTKIRSGTFRIYFFAGLLLLGGHLAVRPLV
jgi:uncharacterized membrane protein YfcA